MQNDQQQSGNWQFKTDEQSVGQNLNTPLEQKQDSLANVNWTASEFIDYDKSFGWYAMILIGTLGLATLIFFLNSKDYVSAGTVILAGILFMVFASRKPRVLQYSIQETGVKIGDKFYAFSGFKSFAVIDEGNIRSIELIPTKRFMPAVSMYFDPKDEVKITEVIGSYLAKEDRNQPAIDRLMHKIRF